MKKSLPLRLVSRINSIVHKGGTHDAHRISILDIFGFEDLAENSFEQLCISEYIVGTCARTLSESDPRILCTSLTHYVLDGRI